MLIQLNSNLTILNYELIVEFDSFLNRAELNLSRNTINGYHKKFKTVLIDEGGNAANLNNNRIINSNLRKL